MSRPGCPTVPDYAEIVRFFVPGNPVGKGRPRATRTGHMYTPEKTASYENGVVMAGHVAMAGRPPVSGPVDVLMQIRVKIAPSWPKRRQVAALAGEIFPGSRPDMDNVIKAIFDGMNGVVLQDDMQVVSMIVAKRYSDTPGVDVGVLPAGALLTTPGILA